MTRLLCCRRSSQPTIATSNQPRGPMPQPVEYPGFAYFNMLPASTVTGRPVT
ncbi:MAG: hypothetical protein WA944_12235 [Mycobacterium sp.]